MEALLVRLESTVARRRVARHPSPFPRPRPDLPLGHETLPQIRHIVVLMMENHSFDNYLGLLGRGDGLDVDQSGAPTAANPEPGGVAVRAHRLPSTVQQPRVPTQSWEASHEQWADGGNDGFVRSAAHAFPGADGSVAMGYWTEEDLPFYHALARTFPLADRWFSSCIGPTFPNRRFLLAATANGLTSDSISHTFDYPANGTIMDQLSAHRISWVDYHPVPHLGLVLARIGGWQGLRAGRRLAAAWRARAARRAGVEGEAKSYLQFTADAFPLGLLRYLGHVRSVDRFLADAAAGTLPAVSIVDPDFRRTSEENPYDIRLGEAFSARIVDAVMRGPGWPDTLLIWVYDEHGGYFDHVPPPEAPAPDDRQPEGGGPWQFDRYGFRVPAVLVSPYARPDYVSHQVHDHTSILKLIETKWNLPALTRRDAAADNLLDSLDLDAPPAFARPPTLAGPARAGDPAAPADRHAAG
jgi:phospholipase C